MKTEEQIRELLESALNHRSKGGSVTAAASVLLWVLDEDGKDEQLQMLIDYLDLILQTK